MRGVGLKRGRMFPCIQYIFTWLYLWICFEFYNVRNKYFSQKMLSTGMNIIPTDPTKERFVQKIKDMVLMKHQQYKNSCIHHFAVQLI